MRRADVPESLWRVAHRHLPHTVPTHDGLTAISIGRVVVDRERRAADAACFLEAARLPPVLKFNRHEQRLLGGVIARERGELLLVDAAFPIAGVGRHSHPGKPIDGLDLDGGALLALRPAVLLLFVIFLFTLICVPFLLLSIASVRSWVLLSHVVGSRVGLRVAVSCAIAGNVAHRLLGRVLFERLANALGRCLAAAHVICIFERVTRRKTLLQLLRCKALRNVLVCSHFIRVYLALVGVPLLCEQHALLLHAVDAVGRVVTCAAKLAGLIDCYLFLQIRLIFDSFSWQRLRFLIV